METKNTRISAQKGFQEARLITQKYAKTFYFASKTLSKEKKYAAYSIYSICRLSDESVDNIQNNNRTKTIKNIKESISLAYSDTELNNNLLAAFRETVNKYKIPKEYFDDLIEGMSMDLNKNRYNNFQELYLYCYRVAGVIGLMILKIFGYKDKKAEEYAVKLGIAMQLTNILSDSKEDFNRNRIYIPQDQLAAYQISETDIKECGINENIKSLIKAEILRAKQYYESSMPGIRMIQGITNRLTVIMMKEMYAGILDAIKDNGYDVFSKRAHLTAREKIFVLLKIIFSPKKYI